MAGGVPDARNTRQAGTYRIQSLGLYDNLGGRETESGRERERERAR